MIDLRHGDCLEIMPTIPDGSVDMILCDLPYGTTACKWDVVIPFEPLWKEYKRIIKKNGAIVLFGSQPFTSALVMSNPKIFRYEWVWEKSKATGFLNSKKRPLISHETILIFSIVGNVNYYAQMRKGLSYNKGFRKKQTDGDIYGKFKQVVVRSNGDRYPRSVIYCKTAESEGDTFHKTQKPVALLEYLIKTYTLEGETVMDNTMGSGSTGVACKNLNRNFIGIEKDDKYFAIAEKRIHGTMPQEKLLF